MTEVCKILTTPSTSEPLESVDVYIVDENYLHELRRQAYVYKS